MRLDPKLSLRLRFLCRVIDKECHYLQLTDTRLFKDGRVFTEAHVAQLETDIDLAEQIEAFVSRFARLQDNLGDKLLPQLLLALGERPGAAIDNFDKAERLGFILSVDDWLAMRYLRNQMVHEYIEDPAIFVNALQAGHAFVPQLITTANQMMTEINARGWLGNENG